MATQLIFFHRSLNVLSRLLVVELGRMNTHNGQPSPAKSLVHLPDPGDRADTVDSTKRPNIQNHNPAGEGLQTLRRTNPFLRILSGKLGRRVVACGLTRRGKSQEQRGARTRHLQRQLETPACTTGRYHGHVLPQESRPRLLVTAPRGRETGSICSALRRSPERSPLAPFQWASRSEGTQPVIAQALRVMQPGESRQHLGLRAT